MHEIDIQSQRLVENGLNCMPPFCYLTVFSHFFIVQWIFELHVYL